jgi:hypothetical protein
MNNKKVTEFELRLPETIPEAVVRLLHECPILLETRNKHPTGKNLEEALQISHDTYHGRNFLRVQPVYKGVEITHASMPDDYDGAWRILSNNTYFATYKTSDPDWGFNLEYRLPGD